MTEAGTMKAAWARIRDRYAEKMGPLEVEERGNTSSPSINDEIQTEYRAKRITEAERDAMREHVKVYLGDPEAAPVFLPDDGEDDYRWLFGPRRDPIHDYARYSCGMWAPSVGPMGKTEHAYILAAVTIMAEEAK